MNDDDNSVAGFAGFGVSGVSDGITNSDMEADYKATEDDVVDIDDLVIGSKNYENDMGSKNVGSKNDDISASVKEFIDSKSTVESVSILNEAIEGSSHESLAPILSEDVCRALSMKLCEIGVVASLRKPEDCGYDAADFTGAASTAGLCMRLYRLLLSALGEPRVSVRAEVIECVRVDALRLAAEHMKSSPWTSTASTRLAKLLLSDIAVGTTAHTTSDLCAARFGTVLDLLRSRLSSWKRNPASVAAFRWCLVRVGYLDEALLSVALPASLRLVDDFEPVHQVAGTRCLRHVVGAACPAVLRRDGSADVVHAALRRLVSSRHPGVVASVLSALPPCLPRLDSGLAAGRAADLLSSVVAAMDGESLLALRRIYALSLPPIIALAAAHSIAHLPACLRVFTDYLEVVGAPDERTRCAVLHATCMLVTHTWPRFTSTRRAAVVTAVMRCVYDVATSTNLSASSRDDVIAAATQCLVKLKHVSRCHLVELLGKLHQVPVNDVWHGCIRNVLEDDS